MTLAATCPGCEVVHIPMHGETCAICVERQDGLLALAHAHGIASLTKEELAWPNPKDRSKRAVKRRKVRGCDWTLGGLFTIHRLAVVLPDSDEPRPCFDIATPQEAQELWLSSPGELMPYGRSTR